MSRAGGIPPISRRDGSPREPGGLLKAGPPAVGLTP